MSKLKLIETIQTKLPTLSKTDGQLIVVRDNASLHIDLDGNRIYISDWIDISTDTDRLAMLTPLSNKYYYVVETNKIWRYIGGSWVLITSIKDLNEHIEDTNVHITSTERTKWNTASTNSHTHSNKTVLDGITSALITAWNNAVTHISDTVKHITSTERTNWETAYTHSQSAHAPSGAEVNQNAFSNVVVGSTTISADSKTDSLTLVGSNVTLTPDATNDKVTIGITKANVTSALGYTPPTTNTTYSEATTSSNGLMSSVDKSKLDNVDSYATNIPFIIGTQTAVTGTWTGTTSEISSLVDGQTIRFWLPYNGSGNATLNLTLSDGTTTGAIACYWRGSTRLTTHYVAGSVITLTYRKSVSIAGSGSYTGWWADADFDSNTMDRIRYQQNIKCGTTAIVAGNIIVGNAGVYNHLKAGTAFDITYPILYANTAITASGTGTDNYLVRAFTVTTTQSITLTSYKPVFIKGSLNGTIFTPINTTPLTQTIPTTDDGYEYILLGVAYSSTAIFLLSEHPIFAYKGGAFGQISSKGITDLSVSGKTVTFTRGDGTTGTITTQDTTYSVATTSANGLMSTTDKTKLEATNIAYGTCATEATTAAKVITISGNTNWKLVAGSMITIKFSATNTAQNPTFNVNGTGAKPVWYNTAVLTTSNLAYAGTSNRPMKFVYDGSNYVFIGHSLDNNSDTKATQTNTTTSADYRVVLSTNANDTTETNTLRKSTNFTANPSTGAFFAKGFDRITITGQTLDVDTLTLSTGSPEIMKYICKTSGGSSNISNIPITNSPFILDVELIRWASTTDYITKQTFVSIGDKHNEYVRYCTNGTWETNWTKRLFTDNNTTYSVATTSANGLMSKEDKAKLDVTNIAYATCSTAATTSAKVATIDGNTNWKLQKGSIVVVKYTNTNTASNVTLNVNNTGAKSIWYNNAVYTGTSNIVGGAANRITTFMYDGTNWVWMGQGADTNTTYSPATLGQGYGTCTTAEATTAKVVTLSSYALVVGGIVSVKFTYAVPASATMNINSKGAKAIYYKGAAIKAGVIKAGDIATFIYNGSQYHLISIDTTLDTLEKTITVERARIDELYNTKENISIIETTETTMPNSCEGRLLFKEILGNTEQDANPQEIKSVAISRIKTHDDNGNESSITFSQPIKLNKFGGLQDKIVDGKIINSLGDIVINGDIEPMTVVAGNNGGTIIGYRYNDIGMWAINTNRNTNRICDKLQPPTTTLPNDFKDCPINHWGFNDNGYRDEFFIFCIEENFSTKSEVQSWLKTNPIRIIFELAEPITDIPVADQVALNSLKTFDDTTYLEIDSPLQPEFVAEYGTSKVGAYTLESLLTAINNDIRISSVEATIVNNI